MHVNYYCYPSMYARSLGKHCCLGNIHLKLKHTLSPSEVNGLHFCRFPNDNVVTL